MTDATYNVLKAENGAPIKAWTKGVQLEDAARLGILEIPPENPGYLFNILFGEDKPPRLFVVRHPGRNVHPRGL